VSSKPLSPSYNPSIPTNKPGIKSNPDFFQYLFHHKKLVLLATAISVSFMIGYVWLGYTPKYTSRAAVLIKDSAVKSNYTGSEEYQTTSAMASSSVINTMTLLNTKPVSDALYDYFRFKRSGELKRLKIKSLQEWEDFFQDGSGFITPKNKTGTDVILVKFTWPSSPVISQEGLNTVLHAFQTASQEVNRSEQSQRYFYLSKQYDSINRELENTRSQLSQYKNKTLTANIGQETVELENARMELQRSFSETQADAEGKKSQLSRLTSSIGLSPESALEATSIGTNATLSKLYDKYYSLSQDYSKTSAHYTDDSPKVSAILSELKQTAKDIDYELKRTHGSGLSNMSPNVRRAFSDPAHMQTISQMVAADSEAVQLQTKAGALKRQLAMLNNRLSKIPAIEERISNIKQKEDSLSDSLKTLQDRLMNARLREAQTLSNVFIVDPPRLPSKADAPNEKHLLLLSLIVGFAFGIGATYVKWRLSQRSVHSSMALNGGSVPSLESAENEGRLVLSTDS
jgi:uncharacterized protein involved in exopolysaccharide biosynthesis